MQVQSRSRRGRALLTTFAGAAVVALTACSGGDNLNSPDSPNLPQDPPSVPQYRAAAFVFDVNTAKKTVKVTAPRAALAAAGLNLSSAVPAGPEYSILGGDVISLTTSNYSASGLGSGGALPGKVLVKFDVQITNLLSGAQLIKPTFPVPPSSADRIYMFPLEQIVTTTSGGATGSGNDVIVELPNTGQVAPSTDWNGDGTPALDGSSYNFFNDTGCGGTANDCFRYEAFTAPLLASASTSAQTVGFQIDPTVSNFRARMLVAADVANSGPAVTATVQGVVNSTNGFLGGVTVAVSAAGSSVTAAGTGAYSVANVGAGPHTVSITSGLPGSCTNPGAQNITVGSAGTVTVDFNVTCTAASGSVTGNINFQAGSLTPSLAAAVVTVTPAASGTGPATGSPNAAGAYSISGVAVGVGAGAGNGSVTVANLPSGCTVASGSPASYTGLTASGSAAASAIVINCAAPPAFYQLSTAWSAPSGGQTTLTLAIDMSTLNDPDNNGANADQIGSIQGQITYNSTRLTIGSCSGQSGFAGGINTSNAGQVNFGLFNSSGGTGNVTLLTCTFTINAGGPPVTTAINGLDATDLTTPVSRNITAQIQITNGTLP